MVRLVTVLGFAAFLYAGSAWAQAPAAPPPAVGIVKAEKTPIVVTDRFIGRIQAVQRYNVVARVTAFLDEVVFKEGQEVKEGDALRITTQILDHDAKRLHYIHAMYHADEGYLAATNELMLMNIDYSTRRSAPWPDFAMERIDKMAAAHKSLPVPRQAGRLIGIKKKK